MSSERSSAETCWELQPIWGGGKGELVRKDDLLMPSTDCEAAQT